MPLYFIGLIHNLLLFVPSGVPDLLPPATDPPTLDGDPSEPLWQAAATYRAFIQRDPQEGAPGSEETEAFFTYDGQHLYFAFICHDRDAGKITAKIRERDNLDITQDDQIVVSIDAFGDRRNGYFFSFNPLGTQVDAQFAGEGTSFNLDWDGIWRCETQIGAQGWTAEIAIPFSTLRTPSGEAIEIGFNIMRRVARKNETMYTPAMPRKFANGTMTVSQARRVRITPNKQRKPFHQLVPYVLLGQKDAAQGRDRLEEGGLDWRIGFPNNYVLDLTFNTDFAQAEIDDQQINLTRSQLFFPEKRQFFLEHANVFEFGLPNQAQAFFSRQIGLRDGETVPVQWGGRSTGKTGRLGYGALFMRTGGDGDAGETDSAVVRFQLDLGQRSGVGGITTTKREDGQQKQTFGLDGLWAVDEITQLSAFVMKTEDDSSQQADEAWMLQYRKDSAITPIQVRLLNIGADLDPGLGFVARRDMRQGLAELGYNLYRDGQAIRRQHFQYTLDYITDQQDRLQSRENRVDYGLTGRSEDRITMSMSQRLEQVNEPLTFLGGFTVSPGQYQFNLPSIMFTGASTRWTWGSLRLAKGQFYDGNIEQLEARWLIKARQGLQLDLALIHNTIERQGTRVSGRLTKLRAGYSPWRNITMQAFWQTEDQARGRSSSLRFEWQPNRGHRLYLVGTEVKGSDPEQGETPRPKDREILIKYAYLFAH